jgi:hypothetical protein
MTSLLKSGRKTLVTSSFEYPLDILLLNFPIAWRMSETLGGTRGGGMDRSEAGETNDKLETFWTLREIETRTIKKQRIAGTLRCSRLLENGTTGRNRSKLRATIDFGLVSMSLCWRFSIQS